MLEGAAKIFGVFTDSREAMDTRFLDTLPPALFLHHIFPPSTVPPNRAKFMLFKIVVGEEEKLILRTIPGYLGHRNIVQSLEVELRDRSLTGYVVEQQRGGWMIASPLLKKIIIGGTSFEFGSADHVQARELLQAALSDYEITIDYHLK